MSKSRNTPIRPFFNILLIVVTMFSIAFIHMEELRMGYRVLHLSKRFRTDEEQLRVMNMQLARMTRPQHVESLAQSQFELRKINTSQIIHLTGNVDFSSNQRVKN